MADAVFPPNWHPDPRRSVERRQGKPGRPFIVTASEIQSFRRCEGAWNFTSANRQSLFRKGMPIPALNIGGGVHYALARHWAGNNWLQAVNEHYAATKAQVEKDYHEMVGTGLSDEEYRVLSDERWEVQRLLEAYFARYGHDWPTRPFRIVAAEVTFAVPLVPEQNIWLMGTVDRIYEDYDHNWLPGEIKTYKTAPKRENWRYNFQLYIYACALAKLLGSVPPMALYDGLRKKGPTTPQILKSGRVSQKWIDTTYDEYIRVVRATHRGRVPNEYRDYLSRLLARDQSPMNAFTTRFKVPLLRSAMTQFWDQAQMTAMRMLHAYEDVTFNKDWQGCPMCRVRDLCDAKFGGDEDELADLIERNYRTDVSPTRKALRIATPKKVKSLADLVEFARDQPVDPLRSHSILGADD
ncbi:MAG TPA: PD-(D/E)XK nuclease family protein [Nitrospira sp.]|nr:PD-(D/E)XK nuclease family protein [Nitrospira sp.]